MSGLNELGVVYRSIQRADADAVQALSSLGTATVHEAMGRVGLMRPYMRPIYPSAHACGTAVTVLLHPEFVQAAHVPCLPPPQRPCACSAACSRG